MAMQSSLSPITPLFAATVLAGICTITSGDARSSEPSAPLAAEATSRAGLGRAWVTSALADAVVEARWARTEHDYVLDVAGRIFPAQKPAVTISAVRAAWRADEDDPNTGNYNSDSFFLPGGSRGLTECGPSPATPAEIKRLVINAAQRHKVDAGLAIAIATAESRLDRLRNSPKGARGPMQLMPETAKRFGVTDICDPEENIEAGMRYLRALVDEFRNPMLVAAAYNAGEGRVREHGGIPPFRETVGYVAEVINLQMGLERPGRSAHDSAAPAGNGQPASSVSGVITARERRQWIGGVMHF